MSKLKEIKLCWPASIPQTQFSEQFLQGMLDRMAYGFHNYGAAQVNFPKNYDAMKSLRQRLRKYRLTHNTEWLMDAGNFLMIEFMYPKDTKAFFEPTTRHESPGSTLRSGRIAKGKDDFDPTRGF